MQTVNNVFYYHGPSSITSLSIIDGYSCLYSTSLVSFNSKLFPCSTQLSTKFFLLINNKMPTIVGILTFMNGKDSILGLYEPKKNQIS